MRRRYCTLDGLRGVGALFVVLLHFARYFDVRPPAHGYLAVDLFFCLSGFVLSRGYAEKLIEEMTFGSWIGVRLRRLYPLFFLSILVGFVCTAIPRFPGSELGANQRLEALGANLLLLPSPTWSVMKATFPLNFVAWSLFVEMLLSVQFYWSAKMKDSDLWRLSVIALIGLVGLRFLTGYVSGGYSWHDLPMGIVRGLFSFSVGMLIARKTTGYHLTSRWAWIVPILAALIFAADPPHGAAYDLVMIICGFPLIVLISIHLEPPGPFAFRLSGDLSYACYALHWTTFFAVITLLNLSAGHPGSPVVGVAVLAGFLLICHLLDRLYDAPLRKLKLGLSTLSAVSR